MSLAPTQANPTVIIHLQDTQRERRVQWQSKHWHTLTRSQLAKEVSINLSSSLVFRGPSVKPSTYSFTVETTPDNQVSYAGTRRHDEAADLWKTLSDS